MDGGFNLTWDVAYEEEDMCKKLYYRVRLRTKSDPDEVKDQFVYPYGGKITHIFILFLNMLIIPQKGQIYTTQQNQQSMLIISETLPPGRQYVADIQVAVHPRWFTSMWSEWSNSVEWTSDSPETDQYYFLLLALPLVAVVLLVYSGKL